MKSNIVIRIELDNRGIGTEDVKKKKDKGVKIRMELSMTYLKLAKMIYTKEIRDLEDCKAGIRVKKNVKEDEHGFEKALADQDELLEVEVKDAEALVYQGFKQKELASENQRVTYLGHEQDRLKPANYDKSLKTISHKILEWYLKHAEGDNTDGRYNIEFCSCSCISRVEDQMMKLKWNQDLLKVDVKNNRSNGELLVSKMNDEKEDKKMDNLPELDREVIQNIKWNENSEVVMPEIGMDAANMDNEIIDYLFNPGGSCWRNSQLNKIKRKTLKPATTYIYAWKHKIKWRRLLPMLMYPG
ncbi:hypothetical protein F8M41_025227 [Gigaspora margarita]|uniref:Uncharacterized protein n=1 Tax=Gigaspora margarita TaxID=4874 RepID=A0A8H3XKL5_GIGMA|nr:hypothetical protein F8M41_025227 [Gigaspora margarita]